MSRRAVPGALLLAGRRSRKQASPSSPTGNSLSERGRKEVPDQLRGKRTRGVSGQTLRVWGRGFGLPA
jgi:hypothetical protein